MRNRICFRHASLSAAVAIGFLLSGCAPLSVKAPTNPDPPSVIRDYDGVKIRYRNLTQPWAWNQTEPGDPTPSQAELSAEDSRDDTVIEVVTARTFEADDRIVIPFGLRSHKLERRGHTRLDGVIQTSRATSRYRLQGGVGLPSLRARTLAQARTTAVRAYLLAQGVDAERIEVAEYDPQMPGLRVIVGVDWE
jgi:hypothetical protein